jgi:hypothetical protein
MPISEEGPDTILKTIGEIPSAVKYGSGIETSAFSCEWNEHPGWCNSSRGIVECQQVSFVFEKRNKKLQNLAYFRLTIFFIFLKSSSCSFKKF